MKPALWIDLDNSPHVPLFAPLIKHYRNSGVGVVLTARDHAQTVELLRQSGFGKTFEVIGRHYGKNKFKKIFGMLLRARELVSYISRIRKKGIDIKIAVSHGSRSMVLAARWMRIPVLTMYDYEFTETKIFNRFSDEVLIPDRISDETLDEIGLPFSKRVRYPGYKEEIYLAHYQKDENFWRDFAKKNRLQVSEYNILIAVRPPATTANYHDSKSDALFKAVLRRVFDNENTFVVILPRTEAQKFELQKLIEPIHSDANRYIVLEHSVSGLDLISYMDVLISGGGTMNREAALIGTPVYSIFAGRQGALDFAMEKEGLITFVRSPEEIGKIRIEKKPATRQQPNATPLSDRVEQKLQERIDFWLSKT